MLTAPASRVWAKRWRTPAVAACGLIFLMRSAPVVVGVLYFMAGYIWAAITRMHRPVTPELMAFHRKEQLTRRKRLLRLA